MVQAMKEQEERVVHIQKEIECTSNEELRSQLQAQLRKEVEVLDERSLLVSLGFGVNDRYKGLCNLRDPHCVCGWSRLAFLLSCSTINEAQQASTVDVLSSSNLFFIGDLSNVLVEKDPMAPHFHEIEVNKTELYQYSPKGMRLRWSYDRLLML